MPDDEMKLTPAEKRQVEEALDLPGEVDSELLGMIRRSDQIEAHRERLWLQMPVLRFGLRSLPIERNRKHISGDLTPDCAESSVQITGGAVQKVAASEDYDG